MNTKKELLWGLWVGYNVEGSRTRVYRSRDEDELRLGLRVWLRVSYRVRVYT